MKEKENEKSMKLINGIKREEEEQEEKGEPIANALKVRS